MRRPSALVAALLLAGACDAAPPIPREDLLLRVTSDAGDVELGKAFSLRVVRVWNRTLAPAEWDDRALAPLTVRLVATSRREDDARVEETRDFHAYAFRPGPLTVPAPVFEARSADGTARTARGDAIVIRTRGALDPRAPGDAELPPGPLREPFPWRWAAIGAAFVAASALVLAGRRRRLRAAEMAAVTAAPEGPPPEPPADRALRRLESLAAAQPAGASDMEAWYGEAAEVLRTYLTERFGMPAHERTSQEILAALPAKAPRAALADALAACDLVKFADVRPSPDERAADLGAARRFIVESREDAQP